MDVAQFTIPPVVKTIIFPGPPEQAFDRFTQDFAAWWPLATHSLGREEKAVSAGFESLTIGAHLIERWRTGETHVWGTLLTLDRPKGLSFTWHVGRNEDAAQLIELSFTLDDRGRTTVRLTHAGWERLGAEASDVRNAYDRGWDPVLDRFTAQPVTT